jgi:hypothetical protein
MANRKEIIIALIGLAGVIFTAVASNTDKLFGEGSEAKNVATFESNNDIDVQLRYFVEVSGLRDSLETMKRIKIEKLKQQHQTTEEAIQCVLDNQIQNEQIIEVMVGALKSHITLEEIKEINKFYSSKSMQSYVKASPLVTRDLIDGIDNLYERMYVRNMAIIGTREEPESESCASVPNKALQG